MALWPPSSYAYVSLYRMMDIRIASYTLHVSIVSNLGTRISHAL